MPAPDLQELWRSGRLLNGLFWAGVGLAPLAALVLLLGQDGGPLRVAAVLAILAVVLIGLSITLRRDPQAMRLDLEDRILDEVDTLRGDLRGDIASAARATHRAFGEKLQALYESVEGLRAQVDAARAANAANGHHHTENGGGAGRAYRSAAHDSAGQHSGPLPRHAPASGPSGRAHVSSGVVRHTETVQVTTRQTIVDPLGDADRGTVYGGSEYPERDPRAVSGEWPIPPPRGRRRAAESDDERWGDRLAAQPARDDPPGRHGRGEEDRWSGVSAGDRWAAVRADDRGSELLMGERRAALQSDETGTQLRVEDRWASVRRDEPRWEARDGARWGARDDAQWGARDDAQWGAREEPRWQAREEPRWEARDEPRWQPREEPRWQPREEPRWEAREEPRWEAREEPRWEAREERRELARWEPRDDRREPSSWDRRDGAPALPAGGIEVTGGWDRGWSEPEREREPVREGYGRRHRDEGYDSWR